MAELINAYRNDPFVGHLATPISGSNATKAFLGNLPAYRPNLSANLRGLEIGAAHGYWLVGPFIECGPLRNTDNAVLAGFLSTEGLICILATGLVAYGKATFVDGNDIEGNSFETKSGWEDLTNGFIAGATAGAVIASFLVGKF